ncbi:nitroreductase family deazaflavin-dependent oxidoreductase [Ornithinimicrobium pekingense]|nr:nitroreductase family deazaflavin-dependent oxidoreductase [Ornithinimicrobium pekingense]
MALSPDPVRPSAPDLRSGAPESFMPERSEWVARQLAAVDAARDTSVATIQGRPIVVVTMRGARTGLLRRVPLMRVEHRGSYLAVASKGGAPEHPVWFHNLRAHGDVLVQDGTEQHVRHARLLDRGPERDAWWERAVEAFPPYADYQRSTERLIPVFVLEQA